MADTEVARRAVYKYPLHIRGEEQTIEMPCGAKIVHVHEQVIEGQPKAVLWAEVNTAGPPCRRTFFVLATGFDDIPEGASHVGTIHVEWTVWHIYEAAQ